MDSDVERTPAGRTRLELAAWQPRGREQLELRERLLTRLEAEGESFLDREADPEHVTASCFVLSADRGSVLLALHRKAGRWLQLGGHVEPDDTSAAAAALREAREEGGIADLVEVVAHPVDVDRHRLLGAFGACEVHWDVGYLAVAAPGAVPVVSDESDEVAWWPLSDLGDTQPHLADRIARLLSGIPGLLAGRST